jgi:2-keto-4-pentenoate hydratase/2-oxohepta-3-ene-1,7-dioic acid hydratase in catechol pathway
MTTVTLAGEQSPFRVGKILCLGRNYAEHAKEMQADIPKVPVVFLKPATAIIHDGERILLPPFARELHHEVELVVLIGREGRDIPEHAAPDHIAGYAVGLDMTLRDVQSDAKKQGLPWSVAKGFDTSAPVSRFRPAREIPDPHNLGIRLCVNSHVRQESTTAKMIFRLERIVSYLSTVFTLEAGDLIFTGTPDGVGPVLPGDTLEASIDMIGTLTVSVAEKAR